MKANTKLEKRINTLRQSLKQAEVSRDQKQKDLDLMKQQILELKKANAELETAANNTSNTFSNTSSL